MEVLGPRFRRKFLYALWELYDAGQLGFHGLLAPLAARRTFAALLGPLFRTRWVVCCKRPFGGPEQALRYLGCYTHRVAISNHRLVALEDGQVLFRWRDSAHKNKKRLMALPLEEFLRRFFLHVLPRGFVGIRHFGFLAHRRRAATLPLCRQLLSGAIKQPTAVISEPKSESTRPLWTCPQCGGAMVILEHFTASGVRLRSPPANRKQG